MILTGLFIYLVVLPSFFDFGNINWEKVDSELGIVIAFGIVLISIFGYLHKQSSDHKKSNDKAWQAVENSWQTMSEITNEYKDFIKEQTQVLTAIHERLETHETVLREVRDAVKACPQKCEETVATLQILVEVMKEELTNKVKKGRELKKNKSNSNNGGQNGKIQELKIKP